MLSRSLISRSKFAKGCVLLILALAAFAVAWPATAKKKSSSKKSHPTKYEKYDKRMGRQERTLMKKMIDQRQAAINLALAGDLGTTGTNVADVSSTVTVAAINAFCKQYAVRMQTEQLQLLGWLKTWYNTTYTPKHLVPGDEDEDEDEDLLVGETGDEYVSALLDQMIGVHARGVAYQKQAEKKKGYHPELREFSNKANKQDAAEIAQIKAWLKLFDEDEED